MKSIAAPNMTEEVIEKIKSLVKNCECDGKIVITPANADELSTVTAVVMKNGGSIAPLVLRGKHVDVDVYVDMSEMTSIIDIDEVAMTVRVQAGCKMSTLIEAVAAEGFTLGVIPAGEETTVEGWVYKEEPGIGSYKYGTVKDSVYNIRAVDCSGNILTTGYDRIGYYMSAYNLIQTLTASNGKLAIVTEVTFKLHPAGITKAVSYGFSDFGMLQSMFMRIVQEPSVKPLHISFGSDRTVIAFQGDEQFIDADIEATDAIMADIGATKLEDGEESWAGIRGCRCVDPSLPTAFIPLKNLDAFVDSVKGSFEIVGNVPDRSTVAVKLVGEADDEACSLAAAKAEEYGGRITCRCHSTYRDEATKKLMKRIEEGFLGKQVEECRNLSREVTPEVIEELKAAVGAKNINTSSVDKIIYSHDLAPLPKEAGVAFNNIPDVIVRVENVEQISAVMAIAYKHGIPAVPRGNASWGLGGCMPTAGGIIIDMTSKMKKVIEINTEELYVKCQAGITWKSLLDACMKKGYIIGSYPSSFPSGTVGAWISTNGMGIGSYKYGSAKDNILNAEVVLDDGSIVTTGYNSTGSYRAMYNLNQFFAGAEGTLAMLGTVTFRIYPMGEIRCLAYEFDNLKEMDAPIQDLVRHPSLKPLHIAWSDFNHFANQKRANVHAPDVTNLWLVTLQGDAKHNDLEEAVVDAMAEKYGGRKISGEIAEHEWEERCYEFRARKLGVGEIPAEVVVPVHDWGTFTDECYEGFKKMKMDVGGVIGVMVDRSTTLFMPYYFKDDELLTGMLAFGFNFYLGDRAAVYGGRSTGFGVFFAWMLDVIHDDATAGKMRDIKTVLDPHDVVNPGHLVCGSTRFGLNLTKGLMGMGSTLMQTMKKLMPKDNTFAQNLDRFRYEDLEHNKVLDRVHKLGDGTQ